MSREEDFEQFPALAEAKREALAAGWIPKDPLREIQERGWVYTIPADLVDIDTLKMACPTCGQRWHILANPPGDWLPSWGACPHGCNTATFDEAMNMRKDETDHERR